MILTVFVLIISTNHNRKAIEIDQTVNAVIGDVSFVETFGIQPTTKADEDVRIQTHLQYVERKLRNRDISDLTNEQQESRLKILDLLCKYSTAGVFPRNYDYPDRRTPCFIDKEHRICAVGYLIEQTAGREIAQEINSKYKYEYLLAMNDRIVDDWIQSSGLTMEECAMIQPAYGPTLVENNIPAAYGVASSVVIGLNLSLNTINGIQISKMSNDKTIPTVGLVTGAGQLTLGALNYSKRQTIRGRSYVSPSQRSLSLINIGLGTSTMVLSSWNLVKNRRRKDKSLSWNVFSFPTQKRKIGLGFCLVKRL